MVRGNTPDSEQMNATSTSHLKVELKRSATNNDSSCKLSKFSDGFRLRSFDEDDNGDTSDSDSYSFECDGLQSEQLDSWIESKMLCLSEKSPELHEDRAKAVSTYLNVVEQTALSDSCVDIALELDTVAADAKELTYSGLRNRDRGMRDRRAKSCLVDERKFYKNPQEVTKEVKSADLQSEDDNRSYAWILRDGGKVDALDFVLLWIAVSVSGAPLLVFQANGDCDLADVGALCAVIESTKEANTVDYLLKALQEFFGLRDKMEVPLVDFVMAYFKKAA